MAPPAVFSPPPKGSPATRGTGPSMARTSATTTHTQPCCFRQLAIRNVIPHDTALFFERPRAPHSRARSCRPPKCAAQAKGLFHPAPAHRRGCRRETARPAPECRGRPARSANHAAPTTDITRAASVAPRSRGSEPGPKVPPPWQPRRDSTSNRRRPTNSALPDAFCRTTLEMFHGLVSRTDTAAKRAQEW